MNILILNWRDIKHSWAGGSELYIHELAKRWVEKGNNVTLFCGQDLDRKLPEREKIDGISVVRCGNRFSVYVWAIYFYFKEFRKNTDLILDVENGIPFFSQIYSRKEKVCLVYHVHGRQFFYELGFPMNIVGYLLEKYLFPFFYRNKKLIAISKSTKKELEKLGFKGKRIYIVEPGVSVKNFGKVMPKKYSKPTLIYLGRIKKYKRIEILINIFPKVLRQVPNARLIIAGWGSEAPFITDMVMKTKTRRKIELIGPVTESEKRDFLAKSWVFVNPSMHEGWGISVIETNLLKTPAVAFNVPGLSDSIKNDYSGFLCKDEDEMIEKLIQILNNEKIRKKMEANAYEWAAKFNWENAAKESLRILKK